MVESQTGRENISKKMVRMERDSLGEKEVPDEAEINSPFDLPVEVVFRNQLFQ